MHHSFIDRFAQGDSPVHRLDARAKLLAVVAYTVVLVSFDRYAVAVLVPLAVAPAAMLWFGRVPLWFALRRVLLLSPLIAMVCLLSPLYDRGLHEIAFGPWHFTASGGWLTAASIAVKFTLGVLALTALTCTTPFALLLEAMRRLAMPRLLVTQLGFLYRYLFVLIDEAMRAGRGRDFRGARRAPMGRRLAAVGGIVGSLFLRSVERSERIYLAMQTRGYRGEPHSLTRLRFGAADGLFLAGVAAYLVMCRLAYPQWIY
ncbi:MAG TPA: cobalt ECF transporter T component CbiQ [Phycisphaerae bacterium]|nr:cobalt ECF transporter T component CbiQ [Phycisphaerae bacterium]